MFKINKQSKNNQARKGVLITKHGSIKTPCFMPIATKGAIKNVSVEEIEKLGAEIILANAYHLYLQPGTKILKQAGGLGTMINWNKPILTDSGGFQVFSLGSGRGDKKAKASWRENLVRVTDQGVEFKSYLDGSKQFLTPESVIEIQEDLGSDILMVLDQCLGWPNSYEESKEAMERTLVWAKRSIDNFSRRSKNGSMLFGIVQGSVYQDLRILCAQKLVELGFDGYAIGGLAVGEPREKMMEVLNYTVTLLPQEKPRYLMGVGRPEEIIEAVKKGIDLFDCVIPTREGRHGRLYLWPNDPNLIIKRILNAANSADQFYQVINITSEPFREDFSVLDPNCDCPICLRGYKRVYLHHLFKIEEGLGLRLASLHNLRFYLRLMELIRANIE